jgi:hypothetical protein
MSRQLPTLRPRRGDPGAGAGGLPAVARKRFLTPVSSGRQLPTLRPREAIRALKRAGFRLLLEKRFLTPFSSGAENGDTHDRDERQRTTFATA